MWKRPDSSLLSSYQDLQEANLRWVESGTVIELFPQKNYPGNLASSQSEITFFKPDHFDYANDVPEPFYVFADEYYIGEIEITNPLQLICERSSDGSLIAISEWGLFLTDSNDSIYLNDLNQR